MLRKSRWVFPAYLSLSFWRRYGWQRSPSRRRSVGPRLELLEDRITPTTGLTPAQIRDYYGVNSIPAFQSNGSSVAADGKGQTIAIVNAWNDPNIRVDVDAFDEAYSLNSSNSTLLQTYGPSSSFLNVYNQQGQNITNYVSQVTGTTGQTINGVFVPGTATFAGSSAEEALDVEMAHAIAPGAKIDLVECNSAGAGNSIPNSDQLAGFATAATLGSVVSMSTAYSEFPSETADDHVFQHPGVTFIASAGDNGAAGGYPAYSPDVLAVGGTQFNVSPSGTLTSEVGWNNDAGSTGGGISKYEEEPSYQAGVQSTGFRTMPDVAFDAGTPVAFYDSFDGSSNNFTAPYFSETGTSIGAPCWAGLIAIVNQGLALKGVAPLNSSDPEQTMWDLYKLGAQADNLDFNDITQGSNDKKIPPVPYYTAGPGYDEVTGLGTPVANRLIPDLLALHPHYVVTTTADSPPFGSETSLRQALAAANAAASRGLSPTITFASNLDGDTIQIAQPEPAFLINGLSGTTTTIDASALPHGITIDANFQSRVFNTFSPAVLDGLTITHGEAPASPSIGDPGAGGGIAAESDLTIENCTIIDNKELAPDPTDLNDFDTIGGGGISLTSGDLTVINSTIASNTAVGEGGGIFQSRLDSGTVTVVNSTIADNTTDGSGGGLCVNLATLTNCTIVNNHAQFGGGIVSAQYSPILQNTIVADNSASSVGPDVFYHGAPLEASFCLIGDTSGILSIDGSNNIISPAYLGLSSSLGSFGGPTPTIALLPAIGNLPASPAIGAGSVSLAVDAYGNPLTTDQRGLPRMVSGLVDIGAYQTQSTSADVVVTASSDTSGGLTLQDAVNLAEAEAAAAPTRLPITITIAANVPSITLTKPVTVDGVTIIINSAGSTTINGNGVTKLFQISSGANVTLGNNTSTNGITLENADPIYGGIFNAGTLSLVNVTLSGDVATQYGGAIYNTGMLTVSNCAFTNDRAGLAGGAIYNAGGTVILIGSTFSGNLASSGGAIYNIGSLNVTNSTFEGNAANTNGGAIENNGGSLNVASSKFDTNAAGSSGGAIDISAGLASIANSSVLKDHAPIGADVANTGKLILANNTIGVFADSANSGYLVVDDSANSANVTYTITPSTFQISGSAPITYTGAASLTVIGGSGTDTFNVQGTSAATPVTLVTGAGTNVVKVAPKDEELLDIQGDLTIQGHGHTTAVLNDQNETLPLLLGVPNVYTVTSTSARGLSATIFYSGLSGLTLNGDAANDVYNIESTAYGTPVTIYTGLGQNTINVAPTSQDLSQIVGDLTIHGSGPSSAILNDQNDIIPILEDLPSFYYVTNSAVQFDFLGAGTIHYTGLSGLTLNADRQTDDVYDIESTAAGTPVTVITGPNNNEVDVTPINKNLTNLKANLVILQSPAAHTSVTLDDSADTANATYKITTSTVQATGAGTVTYAGSASLAVTGGSGTDAFKVQSTAAATPVTLNTGSGSNTVTVASPSQSLDAMAGPLTVNASTGPTALVVNDQATTGARTWTLTPGNLTATAAAGTNGSGAQIAFTKLASVTLNGGSGGNTFNVQGTDAGTAFTLSTGSGNDTVNVGDGRNTFEEFLGNLTVKGQAGSDTLNLNDQGELDPATQGSSSAYHTEYDIWSPAANGLPARVDFFHVPAGVLAQPGFTDFVPTSLYWQNIQQIVFTDPVGGSSSTHTIQPNALVGTHLTLNGGTLNDTLFSGAAVGQQQTFTITAQNAGTVGNLSFTGVNYLLSLDGGLAKFKFLPGGSEAELNGDGSPAVLDLSALTTPTTVNLPYISPGTYNWGSVPSVVSGFALMTSIVGASGDTLVGGNAANVWSITGKNAGQIGGVSFSGFSNLTGGGQADTFGFVNGGSVTGAVNGGGSVNTLDYSGFTGSVLVDLPLGQATLIGGGVQNIQNVVGGGGSNLLVGNGAGNILTGGTGRNLLIAGGAPGTLLGGPDDDILVGGATVYDSNISALNALMAEWKRTDLPYGARVDHLLHGGGLNGSTILNIGNFTANAGGNTLTGAGGLDLFYGSPTLDTNDWNPSIGEVFVGQDGIHASTQITVGGLSVSAVLDGKVTLAANSSQRLKLTPGNHTIADPRSGAGVTFSVSDSGTVSYNASLEGVLSGAGTSTLTVNGRIVTVDITALSVPKLSLDNVLTVYNITALVFTALPGTYTLWDYIGSGATVKFILKSDGTVSYDSTLEGILTGGGTSTLKVNGRTVTVDITALSVPRLALDTDTSVTNAAPIQFTALPGTYTLWDYIGSGTTVQFTLKSDGTVSYDPTLEGILTGVGTSTLTVRGATETIDATALSIPALELDNSLGVTNAAPFVFTALPGTYTLVDSQTGKAIQFTIRAVSLRTPYGI